jgi:hypothetical protein
VARGVLRCGGFDWKVVRLGWGVSDGAYMLGIGIRNVVL